jgi:hypothetical protein
MPQNNEPPISNIQYRGFFGLHRFIIGFPPTHTFFIFLIQKYVPAKRCEDPILWGTCLKHMDLTDQQ